jgi:hypothetical protein
MPSLLEEFINLTETLNREKIDYAICGGFAMAIHGFVRATIDIDLLVQTEDLPKARKAAEDLGYDVECLPLRFSEGAIEIRRFSKIDKESKTLFTIDFLLVTDALQKVWENRLPVEWERGKTWVVSREDFIFLKKLVGRPQDLVDIERLENEAS